MLVAMTGPDPRIVIADAVGVLFEGTVGTTVTDGHEMLTAAEMIETRTAETDATVVVTDTATETMTGTTAETIEVAMTIGGGRAHTNCIREYSIFVAPYPPKTQTPEKCTSRNRDLPWLVTTWLNRADILCNNVGPPRLLHRLRASNCLGPKWLTRRRHAF